MSDLNSNSTLPVESTNAFSFIDEEGWYRVKRLYRDVLNGEESTEAGLIYKSWYYSLFVGGGIGSTIGIRPVYLDFKKRFNEFQFQNKSDYARRLFDCTLSTCMRNGMKMAWRASLLSTAFTATTLTLAVYHNDIRFTDMIFSFALAGGFYTFHRGPKAMLAGATLTGLAGIPVAGLIKFYFWASEDSYADLSDRGRAIYDAPYVRKMKRIQQMENRWRLASVEFIDDYKSYIYHQRRVNRLESIGIVDTSFENLKPGEAKHPSAIKKVDDV